MRWVLTESWSARDVEADEPDYVRIGISVADRDRLLRLIRNLQALRAWDATLLEMVYWGSQVTDGPHWLAFDWDQELFGGLWDWEKEDSGERERGKAYDVLALVGELPPLPENFLTSTECVALVVREDQVFWRAISKHGDSRYESRPVSEKLLQELFDEGG